MKEKPAKRKKTIRKIAGGIVVFIFIMALSTLTFAAEITNAAAMYDKSTNTVTVTGKISTGAGKRVTFLCLPIDVKTGEVDESNIIYIDQITTENTDGSFALTFKMPDNAAGSYVINMSGTGVNQKVSVIFSVDDSNAAEITNAAATYDKSTNTVTVTGKISTGAGKRVTFLCLPIDVETGEVDESNIIYIDQITTENADGSFALTFKMPDNAAGSYVIYMSGTGVNQKVSVIFSVDDSNVMYGDVNGDGEISAGDAILILRNSIGLISFTDEQKIVADVNGDGEISAGDAILILRYSIGLINKFPVE